MILGIAGVILAVIFLVWQKQSDQPREAPETEAVLQAQATLPFQILIPAYLPAGFKRDDVQIDKTISGNQGQEVVRLVYTHPIGVTLTLYEQQSNLTASTVDVNGTGSSVRACHCMCTGDVSSSNALMVDDGTLHVMGETSDPALLSPLHVQTILTTLGPASGLITYTTLEKAFKNFELPPAEAAQINASGEQEIFLVVSRSSYTPVHFSVKKGIPVRLVFRQLGYVSCGNELYLPWSSTQTGHVVLSGPNDQQTFLFTPEETGDFLFHCPHYIYRGVMTVVE